MPENEEVAKATVAQQDVAKAIGTKAEAAATATAGDELSEEDLEAVAGGFTVGILYATGQLSTDNNI
jgi:hypothetical protein